MKRMSVVVLPLALLGTGVMGCSDSDDESTTTSSSTTSTSGTGGSGGSSSSGTGGSTGGAGGSGGSSSSSGTGGAGGGAGGASSAAPGTYVINGDVKTIGTVTCDLWGGGPQWVVLSINNMQTSETFSIRFLGEPTVGTYPVVETQLTSPPTATDAMIGVVDDQAAIWLAKGGGDVAVSDDGGKLHFEATNIPLAEQGNDGYGSINTTCP